MLIKFFCFLNNLFCKQSFLLVCRTWISIALFVEQAWEVFLRDLNHVLTGWPNLDQHFSMCLFVDQASEVLLSDVMTGRPDTDHLKQGVHDQRQERLLTNIGARSPPKVNAGEICISHPSHCWWGGTSCLPREGEEIWYFPILYFPTLSCHYFYFPTHSLLWAQVAVASFPISPSATTMHLLKCTL